MLVDVLKNLPTRKNELWKYTSLKPLQEVSWATLSTDDGLSHEELKKISSWLSSDCYNFVFVNGVFNKTLSDAMESWISEDTSAGLNYSGSDAMLRDLYQATTGKKLKLTLPAKTVVEKPVQILFVSQGLAQTFQQTQLEISLASQSQLKLATRAISLGESKNFNLLHTHVQLQAASQFEWLHLQDLNARSFSITQNTINLDRDAVLNFVDLTLGGAISRTNTESFFKSENAHAGLFSCMALNKEQHADLYSSINHLKGHNNSNQLAKSVLNDSAQSVFRGRVYIAVDAQKANSEQLNNNLLLSRSAKANSIPQLEIHADDVKAGHGSTMGQMNQDEIFYFLSRGIAESAAVKMIAEGFAKEVVFKLADSRLQNIAMTRLQDKLDRMI